MLNENIRNIRGEMIQGPLLVVRDQGPDSLLLPGGRISQEGNNFDF